MAPISDGPPRHCLPSPFPPLAESGVLPSRAPPGRGRGRWLRWRRRWRWLWRRRPRPQVCAPTYITPCLLSCSFRCLAACPGFICSGGMPCPASWCAQALCSLCLHLRIRPPMLSPKPQLRAARPAAAAPRPRAAGAAPATRRPAAAAPAMTVRRTGAGAAARPCAGTAPGPLCAATAHPLATAALLPVAAAAAPAGTAHPVGTGARPPGIEAEGEAERVLCAWGRRGRGAFMGELVC